MPNLEVFSTGLSYIDTFIEQSHHPKEDEFLFPALRRHTDEHEDVMRQLQRDHVNGTLAFKELNTALDDVRLGGLTELHRFADLMERFTLAQFAHQAQEETVVLPLARRLLVEEDWSKIERGFRANRDPLFGAEGDRKFGILFRSVGLAAD
jgi:hemerythrin-like domain-containing protein